MNRQREACSPINLMSIALHFCLMPVDRELAYECLKWVDPKVYRAYIRLKYREITDEEFQNDKESFYKLRFIA